MTIAWRMRKCLLILSTVVCHPNRKVRSHNALRAARCPAASSAARRAVVRRRDRRRADADARRAGEPHPLVAPADRPSRRPPPAVRRRDHRRADGDARRGGRRVHHLRGVGRRMAHHPETSASGHFSGMPTRSLHARSAVARDDASGRRPAARRRGPSPRPPACGWG